MTGVISWDVDKLKRFKRAYARALEDKLEVFAFEGHDFVPGYAKYLIEYLEDMMRKAANDSEVR